MDASILVSIISASAVVVSASTAVVIFSLTKRKEREAELRKQKVDQYGQFLGALSDIAGTGATPDGMVRFAKACNTIGLVATQSVLDALWQFQSEIVKSKPDRSEEKFDQVLNQLFLAIRGDLGVSPKDDPSTFRFRLWASGVNG